MSRFHIFADEAGCFTFSAEPNVSRFLIMCTVIMRDCSVGNDLLALRRELAWRQAPLGEFFHASNDQQSIRDAVFKVVCTHDFTSYNLVRDRIVYEHDLFAGGTTRHY